MGVGVLRIDRVQPMAMFICFSERKLVAFLRLILKSASLVEHYYQPWSYTKQTGRECLG